MPKRFEERKRHIHFGRYVKDIVFAGNDGIITTFAVVAGTAGAELSSAVVLIIGFANLIADGFSMAIGNYLGTKSEYDLYEREKAIETEEVKYIRGHELAETREILLKKGFSGEKLEHFLTLISSNKELWVEFMMHHELELFKPDDSSPIKNSIATFISFVLGGVVPLLPYLGGYESSFLLSAVLGGIALFVAGALRKFISDRPWVILGMEMFFAGSFAAFIAYFVGFILKQVFGV